MARRSQSKMKFIIPLLLFVSLSLVSFLIWFIANSQPVNSRATGSLAVTINKGQGLNSIATTLHEKDLIKSTLAFYFQARVLGLTQKLQAGDYYLSQRQNLKQIVLSLTRGSLDKRVTFIEGWRKEQIAQNMVDNFSHDNPDYAFNPTEFLSLTKSLEGQLFPDTYSFPKDVSASTVVDRLTKEFRDNTLDLINQSSLTDAQALVLASLIEREAITDTEKPIIAGIIMNRLQNSWPLQIDATIQYAKTSLTCKLLTCDYWPNNITKVDLLINSPYNTYANQGLPPAPICNPSLSSIKAAYNPAPTAFWFYLHDNSGQIHYAKTIEEHNLNIAKYLQK